MRKCPQCGDRYEDVIAFCPNDGARTEPLPADDALIGAIIDGRYRIEQRIGEGGMGYVYRATHVVLKKPFALKLIRGDQASDSNIVERFGREARAASGIGHPNIVNINDFGHTSDGAVYLAMEYLEGMTLADAMRAGPIALARALEIFIQIADALEAAHAQGIVHRDLKPENVFLMRDDFVKVLDFGIAKVKNAAAKLTRTGLVFGTPDYMSPEQAAGQPVDHRSDIYSLGVIMYQVLAGQLPFTAESLMALMTKHMFEPAPSLRDAGHAVPSALDALVGRCLQKKPELRHASMRELESDLRRVQLSPVSEPRPPAPLSAISLAASLGGSAPPGAFTAASETLDEAALAGDVVDDDQDDMDEPIRLPKQRPVWLWAVAAGILVMLALSLSVRSRSGSAEGSAAAAGAAALDELPRGLSAPAPEVEVQPRVAPLRLQPSAADTPGAQPAAAPSALHLPPSAADGPSASRSEPSAAVPSEGASAQPSAAAKVSRSQPAAAASPEGTSTQPSATPKMSRAQPAAAVPAQPIATPVRAKTTKANAAPTKATPEQQGEVLDPWR